MTEQNNKAETLIGLVSHYSPSGQESAVVEWLTGHMQKLGYSETHIDGAGNAIGIMGDGPRQLVLLGHIDTVPGEIPVRTSDGTLYGRGTVDAKGPLAGFVDAVAQVGPVEGWQFVVIGAVDEERESCGARFVASQYHPNYYIIGEPNRWYRVALGYKGLARFELKFKHSQAHAASTRQTACEAALETWQKIRAHADSYNADKQRAFDIILLTLRGMYSEEADFMQHATLQVDTRLPLDYTPEQWYNEVQEMLGNANAELVRKGFSVPAYACEKNTPLVRAFLKSIRSHGGKPSFVYKTGTADLNTVAPIWQAPALVYGPGDSKLDHTLEERIPLEEYHLAVSVLVDALKELTDKQQE